MQPKVSPQALAKRSPLGRGVAFAGAAAIALLVGYGAWRRLAVFPAADTPAGVYFRVGRALDEADDRALVTYLEEDAQRACATVREQRKRASERVAAAYPEPERTRLLTAYAPEAKAEGDADVFVELAKRFGLVARLRQDMSGIARVDIDGDAATLVTARGTRYGLTRGADGAWGLTLFTPELAAEAARATRDAEVVAKAAEDYARGRTAR